MARARLCALSELPQGESRVFDVADFVLAAARSGNRVFVLEDRCSHDDGEFEQGRVIESEDRVEIECPRHGGRFDMASGAATRMPAIAPIESFTATIEDDQVWVELPEE